MADYLLKEWLTFEEAASWLSDQSGKLYNAQTIQRAVTSFRLPAHYWPTDHAEIGLFELQLLPGAYISDWRESGFRPLCESPMHLDTDRCVLADLIEGPVPFHQYEFFIESQIKRPTELIGISALLNADELYGCYRLDDQGRPASIFSGPYQALIHLADLEEMLAGLPLPRQRSPHEIESQVWRIGGTGEMLTRSRSTVQWFSYPESIVTDSTPSSTGDEKPATLRALGFATHLIAQLGQELDEKESIPSKQKGFTRGETPNISAISRQLAAIAKLLNHEGHGVKGEGFQKILRSALREI
ncbi:MAG: hypothetical protein ACN6P1_19990 [Pseudomonas sp.]|uniref:hypothetical protein n=1 Tax=Pseudomonas sp. TaxID=306 RepID=UPI003D0C17CB